jgi:hypothetical protein
VEAGVTQDPLARFFDQAALIFLDALLVEAGISRSEVSKTIILT